ncbi:LysR family transcriptional regulator, partial [bacterium]|nr:LysR family transcriptional regulator [bacterium]
THAWSSLAEVQPTDLFSEQFPPETFHFKNSWVYHLREYTRSRSVIQMQHISIELIPIFLMLAEELNISRCAKKLGLSQPALTRQLQALEESFGSQLFIRQSRGLALTQTGRTLTFGCFSEIGTRLIAPALFEFAKMHKQIQLDIRYLTEVEIISAVSHGQLHLGIASRAPDAESVRSYKLLEEKVHIVTARGNPDLEKHPNPRFAGYRTNDRLLHSFLKSHFANRYRVVPDAVVAVNSHAAILDAVVQLGLYAVLPEHSLVDALRTGHVRLASSKQSKNQVHIIVPESEFHERKTLETVKFLRKKFKTPEGRDL